jgi:hypothetical protein
MIEILKGIFGELWDYGTVDSSVDESIVVWSYGKMPTLSRYHTPQFCLEARDGYIELGKIIIEEDIFKDVELFKAQLADPNCFDIVKEGIEEHIRPYALKQGKDKKECI